MKYFKCGNSGNLSVLVITSPFIEGLGMNGNPSFLDIVFAYHSSVISQKCCRILWTAGESLECPCGSCVKKLKRHPVKASNRDPDHGGRKRGRAGREDAMQLRIGAELSVYFAESLEDLGAFWAVGKRPPPIPMAFRAEGRKVTRHCTVLSQFCGTPSLRKPLKSSSAGSVWVNQHRAPSTESCVAPWKADSRI